MEKVIYCFQNSPEMSMTTDRNVDGKLNQLYSLSSYKYHSVSKIGLKKCLSLNFHVWKKNVSLPFLT